MVAKINRKADVRRISLFVILMFGMLILLGATQLDLLFDSDDDIVFSNLTEVSEFGVRGLAPLVYFDMEDQWGSVLNSESVYPWHYGVVSGATLTANCGSPTGGNCYEFGGDGDDISLTDRDVFSFTDGSKDKPFTISAWVKSDGTPSIFGGIVSKDIVGAREWAIGQGSDDKIRFFLKSAGGSNQQSVDSTTTLTVGQWYHLVGTYDGSESYTGLDIYINGIKEVETSIYDQAYTGMTNGAAPVKIGTYYDEAASRSFNGFIDEVLIFDRELTADQILNLYNGTKNNSDYIGTYSNGDFKSNVFYNSSPTYWNLSFNVIDSDFDEGFTKEGLVSWWDFDNDNSTHAIDKIGSNDGIDNGGVVPKLGIVDKGKGFDGSDDSLDLPALSLDGGSNFTMSAWFKAEDTSQVKTIISLETSLVGVRLDVSDSGSVGGYVYDGSNNYVYSSASTYEDGLWHYVTFIGNGTNYSLYLDGVYQDSMTVGSRTVLSDDKIGGRADGTAWDYHFNGSIDEVMIYNRSLSQSEISEIYNEQLKYYFFNVSDQNVVGYWPLDNSTEDLVGGNDGTAEDGFERYASCLNSRCGDFEASSGHWINTSTHVGTNFTTGDEFSYGGWFYLESLPSYTGLVSTAKNGATAGYALQIGSAQSIACFWSNSGSFGYTNSDSAPAIDTWYHAVCDYDGSVMKLYVNGELQTDSDAVSLDTANYPPVIGRFYADSTSWPMDGLIDEVFIMNKSLTNSEVNDIYYGGLSQHANANVSLQTRTANDYNLSDEGLVGLWSFNEEHNTTKVSTFTSSEAWVRGSWTTEGSIRYSVAGSGADSAHWNVTVPNNGSYEVYASATAHSNRATDSPFTIEHDDGSTTVDINQESQEYLGVYDYLGRFNFTSGNIYEVNLTDDANEYVIAQTIMFLPTNGHFKDELGYSNLSDWSTNAINDDSGVVGKGLRYTTSRVRLNDSLGRLNIDYNMTIATWIKWDSMTSNAQIFLHGAYDSFYTDSWYLSVDNGNALRFSTNAALLVSPADYTSGEWHHVVGVLDGSTKSLYVDGVLVNSVASAPLIGGDDGLCIGGTSDGSAPYDFDDGRIDEIRLYNRSLSASEVQNLYELGSTHIEWNDWQEEGKIEDEIGIRSTNGGRFMQYKSVFNTDNTEVTAYLLNHNASFILDDVAPNVTINSSPVDNIYTDEISFNLSADLTDDTSGIKNATLHITENSGKNWIEFDGDNDRINVNNDASLNPSEISFSYWIKTTSTEADQIWDAYNDGNPYTGYGFATNFGGTVGAPAYWSSAHGSWVESDGGGTINDGSWHHVFHVVNSSGNVDFYIDGNFDGNASSAAPVVHAGSKTIGIKTDNNWDLTGALDEIRIYNQTLNSSQILEIYNSGLERNSNLPSNGLVAWYDFDNLDENSSNLVDYSIYSNNGTISGALYALRDQTVSYPVAGTLTSTVGIVVSLADGIYNWFWSLFDFEGNQAFSENRTLYVNPGVINHTIFALDGQVFSGTNLILGSNGSIANYDNQSRIILNFSGIITMHSGSNISGGDIEIYAQNLTIETGAKIISDYLGYLNQTGPGAGGSEGNIVGGGAGHGGAGSIGSYWYGTDGKGGAVYGSSLVPETFGSGGGNSINYGRIGGSGGGRIKIFLSDSFNLSGIITSNGENGQGSPNTGGAGGGSGGSIYIRTDSFIGSGNFSAEGGEGRWTTGNSRGGSGGGGRIAVYYNDSGFNGVSESSVSGGSNAGALLGEDGSLIFIDEDDNSVIIGHNFRFQGTTSIANESIITDFFNFNNPGYWEFTNFTTLEDTYIYFNNTENHILNITGSLNNNLDNNQEITFDLLSDNNFSLSLPNFVDSINFSGVSFKVTEELQFIKLEPLNNTLSLEDNSIIWGNFNLSLVNLTIDSTSILKADYLGYNNATGPGAGQSLWQNGGGAGHGGDGSNGYYQYSTNANGGVAYGSILTPTDFGSGGGDAPGYSRLGGSGGGLIRIGCSDTILLNGLISSNGKNGTGYANVGGSGGGSGGSIYLTTDTIKGNGTLISNGGVGNPYNGNSRGGSGGGGRIAVYSSDLNLTNIDENRVLGIISTGIATPENGTIVFSPPIINTVDLVSTHPSTNNTFQNLSVSYTYNYSDANITPIYNWYKDNVLNATTLITEGLVAYYPLNNDTLDYFGSNDGTNNGVGLSSQGKIGSAGDFSGNNYVEIQDNDNLDVDYITVAGWVKIPSGFSTRSWIAHHNSGDNGGWWFRVYTDRTAVFSITIPPAGLATPNIFISSDTLEYNEWTHLASTWNGTNIVMYINGNEASGSETRTDIGGMYAASQNLYLGYENWNGGYFNGTIDEVMIYNRSLGASEIQQLYQGGVSGGYTINSSQTSWNETWKAGVQVCDAINCGDELNSSSLEILDQVSPNATLNSSPVDNLYTNETSFNLSVDLSDDSSGIKNATLHVVRNDADNSWLEFDGSTDYVQFAKDPEFDLEYNQSFSFSLWARQDSVSPYKPLICKRTGGDYSYRGYCLSETSEGYIRMNLINSNSLNNRMMKNSAVPVELNVWNHIVMTYDGSSNASGVQFYINGVNSSNGTVTYDTLTDTISNQAYNYYPNLGYGQDFGSNRFDGSMDEVRIYNKTLTFSEIQEIYRSSLVRNSSLPSNQLMAWYDFENSDGDSSNLVDYAGGDNNGTINGAVFTDNAGGVFAGYAVETLTSTAGIVVGLVDGIYTWFYELFDWAGNQDFSENKTLTIDTTNPLVEFVAPSIENEGSASGQFISNLSITEKNLANISWNWNGSEYEFNNLNHALNLTEGLVALYNLNNESEYGENDTHVYDFSGNGNNGSVNGSIFDSNGKYGGNYRFNGTTSNQIYFGNDSSTDFNGALSVGTWVKFDSLESYKNIIGRSYWVSESNNGGYQLAIYPSGTGRIRFLLTNNKATGSAYPYSSELETDRWYHAVGTWDGVSTKKLYIDGVLVSTATRTETAKSISQTLKIGGINGSIDEGFVYNRTLSANEVKMLYQNQFRNYPNTDSAYLINQSDNTFFKLGLKNTNSQNYILEVNQTGLGIGANYTYSATVIDKAGNSNTSETRSIIGNAAPFFTNIVNSPNVNASLDPGTEIFVTANLSDSDYNMNASDVILQWKNSTGSWGENNVSMINQSVVNASELYAWFNSSFTTPSYEDTISYRIYAVDELGSGRYSTEYDLSSLWDCTWTVSTSDLGATAGWSETLSIGSLSINNTGDIQYTDNNCTLRIRPNDDGITPQNRVYYNGENTHLPNYFTINAGENYSLEVNVTFLEEVNQEIMTIILNDENERSLVTQKNVSATVVSNQEGPYLYQDISSPSEGAIIYLNANGNFTINGRIRNLMGGTPFYSNLTAFNVTLNWTIPNVLINSSGNLDANYSNLSDNGYRNLEVNLSFVSLEDMESGTQTFTLQGQGVNELGDPISNALNQSLLENTLSLTFLCYNASDGICVTSCGYLQDSDCEEPTSTTTIISSGGGGGGGGGSSGGGGGGGTTEANFELLIGGEQSFDLEIKNQYRLATKKDLKISVGGINAKYIQLETTSINEIAPLDSKNVTVRITAPAFFTKGEHILTFVINGFTETNGTRSPYSETKRVRLLVIEVSREIATEMYNESFEFIDEMNASGMVLKDVLALQEELQNSFDEIDFLAVKKKYQDLKKIYDSAFESKELIEILAKGIAEAEKNGIDVSGSERLLSVAEVAYGRGDFLLALERLEEAKLTFALETKGEFNLIYAVKNKPLESLGIVALASLIGVASSYLVLRRLYKRKLKILAEEEKLLIELMKVVQREVFDKNHLSMEEYEEAMNQYERRLSETVEEKITTETKLANLMNFKGRDYVLKKEKKKLIELIRKTQVDYLEKGTIETRVYENTLKTYTSRLGDIEEEITYAEAQNALGETRWHHKLFKRKGVKKNK